MLQLRQKKLALNKFFKNFYLTETSHYKNVSNSIMSDDRALVNRIMSKDMSAFRLLIKQHERLVAHMVARVIKNDEEREELCQDVFLKVYDKIGEFSFQSKLSTWIATIAYRHAINALRKRKLLISDLPDENDVGANLMTPNPADTYEEQDTESFVGKLIDQLPHQYKIVLSLYHLEGMSYPEIGEVTGMPEGTVKSYLFRARHLLKEKVLKLSRKEELL